MREEVTVTFEDLPPVRLDVPAGPPLSHDDARGWLDRQFTELGCEPFRPTGKLLMADKVVAVAAAAGPEKFGDAVWAGEFARATRAALDKPVVRIDVPSMSIGY